MKRRSFLAMLGLAPGVAGGVAKASPQGSAIGDLTVTSARIRDIEIGKIAVSGRSTTTLHFDKVGGNGLGEILAIDAEGRIVARQTIAR